MPDYKAGSEARCRHCGKPIVKSRIGAWYHKGTNFTKCDPFSTSSHRKATP